MRRSLWSGVVLALSLWLLPVVALAKSPPDKLVVAGPGLAAPVAITDAALAGFSPWTRGFIAWDRGLIATPPAAPAYAVSFYLDGREIYEVHYVPAPAGGPGAIYIPGPTDPGYVLNMGTIITGGSDRWDPNGKWQYATAAWDAVLQRALRAHGVVLSVPVTTGPSTMVGTSARAPRLAVSGSTADILVGAPWLWAGSGLALALVGALAWRGRQAHRRVP